MSFRDPRDYQIATLASLLAYGLAYLDFEVSPAQAALTIGAAIGTQWICTRVWRLPRFDPRSAMISALSLCLLLRTSHLAFAAVAAAIAISSKFAVRVRGKHIFNPTNLAIVVLLATSGDVWVSPGQWGSALFFGGLMACVGALVVNRAARSDVTIAFAAFYLALVFGRSLWLGEPMAIPVHRLQSGALLLFTFFMISDPRTTPDSRTGRVVFAALVAVGAWYIQFRLFRTNGLMWALAAVSMLTPILDFLWPARRYEWALSASRLVSPVPFQGVFAHETHGHRSHRRRGSRLVGSLAPGVLRLLRREG